MRQRIAGLVSGLAAAGAPLSPALAAGAETNIFNADVGNFVFTLVIFGLVVVVLGKFAWRPLLKVLNEREKTIRTALETARSEREAARRLLAEYQAQLDRARAEATAIVEEGRRDAEVVRRRAQEETRQEAAAMLARAQREIRLATDAAVKELYDHTADLAVHVAARVLRKQLSKDEHRQLVRESLAEIESAGPGSRN